MANYNSLYYKQYFAMTEAIKRMQDIIDETDEEFMKLQKPETENINIIYIITVLMI